jgi:hypothetical protein
MATMASGAHEGYALTDKILKKQVTVLLLSVMARGISELLKKRL